MKTNPRNVPRTEADVKRARREGWVEGLRLMEALFLLALCDKCPDVDAVAVWMEVCEKTKSSDKRYFTAADVCSLAKTGKIELPPHSVALLRLTRA